MTEDARLRREIAAARIAVEPVGGDGFAVRLWAASPAGIDEPIRLLIAKRRRRPVSVPEMAAQLAAHFPTLSEAWLGPIYAGSEWLQAAARPREAAKPGFSAVGTGQPPTCKTAGQRP